MPQYRVLNRNIMLASVFVLLGACTKTTEEVAVDAPPPMDALVTSQWLSEHIDDPDLVILDTTVVIEFGDDGSINAFSGLENYAAGHIPTAGFADLMGDLADPVMPGEFRMPSVEQFSQAMGALGVSNDSRVVLYTTDTPDWAARVWWMLRWAGFDQVAILDGGLTTWSAEGRPLSTEPANRPAAEFVASVRPELVADRDEVLAATTDSNVGIVDSLPLAHYQGQFSMYARPGHIVSATNMPSSDLLDENGHYRSFDELDMMHGDDRDRRAITYCGGGIAASSVAFTMHRLGYTDVAVYTNSLQEWAVDAENPMSVEEQ